MRKKLMDSNSWKGILKQYEKSGMKKSDFCREKGITLDQLYYRMRKLRPDLLDRTENNNDLFFPIKSSRESEVTMKLHNIEIKFSEPPNAAWMASVIKNMDLLNADN